MPLAILIHERSESCNDLTTALEAGGHIVYHQYVPKLFTEWFECPAVRVGEQVYFGRDGIEFYLNRYK